MIKKGAAITALVDALESHGKRVIVDTMSCTTRGGKSAETWVRVKDSDAPVQLANLVYMLAHPSTLRRLMFNAWEHHEARVRRLMGFTTVGTYGTPSECVREKRGDIYIDSMNAYMKTWNTNEVMPWLLGKLSDQGIYAEKEEK